MKFLSVIAFIASLFVWWNPPVPWFRQGVIYVSRNGSDWNFGGSPESAVATIQHAADIAMPGDSVIILPGVYREKIYIRRGGLPDKPIIFRALQPGTVTITNETEQDIIKKLKWIDEGDGIFSAKTSWPVYFAKGDGMTFFRSNTVDNLKKISRRSKAWGCFSYDKDRLYISFPDKQDPSMHELAFHSRVPPPGLWRIWKSANVLVEADDIRFEGLRFDFGIGYNLHLWKASNISIADCIFNGAAIGINASGGIRPAENLRVEHCLYHNYPQFEWLGEWLTWAEVYDSYASSTLIASSNDGATIKGNLILHGGDGLRISTQDINISREIDVSENLIAMCTDDAVELDGFTKKIFFHNNLIYNCHESLAPSPVLAGPVLISNNYFLHPFAGKNGAQVKLMDNVPVESRKPHNTIRNVEIRQNIFVGNWLCWHDGSPVEDVVVKNNTFAVLHKTNPPWPEGVTASQNNYVNLPLSGYEDPGLGLGWLRKKIKTAKGSTDWLNRIWQVDIPGPRWLNWKSLPATAVLSDKLSPDFFKK